MPPGQKYTHFFSFNELFKLIFSWSMTGPNFKNKQFFFFKKVEYMNEKYAIKSFAVVSLMILERPS